MQWKRIVTNIKKADGENAINIFEKLPLDIVSEIILQAIKGLKYEDAPRELYNIKQVCKKFEIAGKSHLIKLELGPFATEKLRLELNKYYEFDKLKPNWQKIKQLIINGADVNTQDRYKGTALSLACENDEVEIVSFLLENDAEDIRNAWSNPTLFSVSNEKILHMFIECGANIDDSNSCE